MPRSSSRRPRGAVRTTTPTPRPPRRRKLRRPPTQQHPRRKARLTSALELVHVEPFVTIVGGLKLDTIIQGPTETRQGRISAIGLSDFGLRGNIGKHVSFVSELMFNAGTDLHGSSTWEGQAELQVRQQLIHVEGAGFTGEVGRVIDEGSVNFVSNHIGDALFQDYATEQPLLYSGFNLGNGVRGTYEVVKGLRVGFTFTAGNPTSTSAALQVGGASPVQPLLHPALPGSATIGEQRPGRHVRHDGLFAGAALHAQVHRRAGEFQGYTVNTNTNTNAAQPITGFNVRGGVKVKIADELVTPFANIAVDQNDTVNPANVAQIAAAKYTSVVLTGGSTSISTRSRPAASTASARSTTSSNTRSAAHATRRGTRAASRTCTSSTSGRATGSTRGSAPARASRCGCSTASTSPTRGSVPASSRCASSSDSASTRLVLRRCAPMIDRATRIGVPRSASRHLRARARSLHARGALARVRRRRPNGLSERRGGGSELRERRGDRQPPPWR